MRISSHAYDNGLPAPLAELVIIQIGHEGKRTETPVPLTEITVSGTLGGSIARLRLEQRFELPAAQGSKPIDARYRFPIPGDAAVRGVVMRFADEEVIAALHERREARDRFEHAKATGRAAVLVTDSGRGVLTLEVTGVTPGVPMTVATDLVCLPRIEADGAGVLRIPLTAAPRYSRGDEDETAAEASPAAVSSQVRYRVRLELAVPAGLSVVSPTHAVVVAAEGGTATVRFVGEVVPDRDLVLVARSPLTAELGGSVLLGETRDGRTPWLATAVAPSAAPVRIPRSLLLLVDRSGSMDGPKWSAAEWAVRSLVAATGEDDLLLVAAFDTEIERSSPGLLAMEPAARAATIEWIRRIEPRGGTELGATLEDALRTRPRPGTQAELLVITDGQVSDEARILALADGSAWRISVLCIDAAPNSHLVSALAERGGGDCWFLTSGAEGEEITDAVDRVTAFFATPAVGDLVLRAPAPGIALGRRCRTEGNDLVVDVGALPAGTVRVLAGSSEGDLASGFRLAGGEAAELAMSAVREPAVNALVAACQIRILEHAWQIARLPGQEDLARREAARAGIDPQRLPHGSAVYAPIEGARPENALRDALKALIVERSLAEQVISSQTAFVGVRSRAGQRSTDSVDVPSALPDGWDSSFETRYAAMALPSAVMLRRSLAPPLGGYAPPSTHGIGLLADTGSLPAAAASMISGGPFRRRGAHIDVDAVGTRPAIPRTVELILKVADLRVGVTLPAPAGNWSAIRVSGTIADVEGVYLIIWDRDRTRPLLRARLADLLAAGERPTRMRFAEGATLSLAIEGGTPAGDELRIELRGG